MSARIFTDWCIKRFRDGELTPVDAAKVKLIVTDLHNKVVNECLQFFGGYGYMTEYPIARAYLDARVHRIYGGTNEIMRDLVARQIVGKR